MNHKMFPAIIIITLLSLVLVSCQNQTSAPSDIGAVATATMSGTDGAPMGSVTLTQGPNGLLVSVNMTGLPPGWHGFHLHETGSCSPDFAAAGGHYSPGGHGHGFMHSSPHHPGDMPNIYAGPDGTAIADVFNTKAAIGEDADATIFDSDGSAIIVHAEPDSYGESPGAGDRIACGVITRN